MSRSKEAVGCEEEEKSRIVLAITPHILYCLRKNKSRDKGRKDGVPKFLLKKMDVSLVPLKKNLARQRRGKICMSDGDCGMRILGKSEEDKFRARVTKSNP